MQSRSRRTSLPGPDEPFVAEVGASPLPGYRLLRIRGKGAFATVWEASDPTGQRIAMKFMSSQNASSTAREIRSLQAIHQLNHPYLLQARQVWSLPGYIVIAMELADASALDLYLLYAEEFQTTVDPLKLALYMYQAADALDFLNAHQHNFDGRTVGFQHGDIKPNNILLIGDTAKLADYGLACPMSGPISPCPRQGTLEYAAPEVFQGNLSDSSDQFGLAVSYYLLRTGSFPFPPPPKVVPRGFTRPTADVSQVSADEAFALCRALSPVPQNRFPTCVEMMGHLLRGLGLEAIRGRERGVTIQPALKVGPPPPRRRISAI